jgi:exopolyphosphatase/guanosine-5'-triphosphate,3'-diphosphate pyrophosphatase
MNVAVIDIGTNTVLLLVAALDASGTITPLLYEQRVPRLGQGVDESRRLRNDAMERVAVILEEYKRMTLPFKVATTVVCGTSAVRDADNKAAFADLIRKRTGYSLEVLTGIDEARWAFRGALSGFPDVSSATVVDIGGGSTELSAGEGDRLARSISLDIGSVRITERFFKHDPPAPDEMTAARDFIRNHCEQAAPVVHKGSTLVAVAGTATALAALALGLRTFDREAIAGRTLELRQIKDLLETLAGLSAEEIRPLSDAMIGRSDIITAGTLVLLEIMIRFGFASVLVSERGVRYGLAIREWERLKQDQGRSG